jgi:chromosome segregation ATPase
LLDLQWLVEAVLICLLAATLYYALRLERALGVLKRDRSSLAELVSEFNESTHQAESGIERLRQAADGAGRQIARQSEAATALKGDLSFLVERGERLADRLDRLLRNGRLLETEPQAARGALSLAAEFTDDLLEPAEPTPAAPGRVRSQAERDLLRALKMVR